MKNLSKGKSSEKIFTELLKVKMENGLTFIFKAKGFSMKPFIKNNDIITISPSGGNLIGIGNIAAFISPNTEKLVVHRIVGIARDGYLIKGDNTSGMNEFVPRENILGIVTSISRRGKKISLSLGWEGFVVAFLSRKMFLPFIKIFWRLLPLSIRKKLIR